jgi:hypothetical protein
MKMIAADLNEVHPFGWVMIGLALVVVAGILAMIMQSWLHSRIPKLNTPKKLIRHHALILQSHAEGDPSFKKVATEFARLHHDLVPATGAAPTVSGEILRSANRLAGEERRNGNINWSKGYAQFVSFLRSTLATTYAFDDLRRAEILGDLQTIESHAKSPVDRRRIDEAFTSLIRASVDYCAAHTPPAPYVPHRSRTL